MGLQVVGHGGGAGARSGSGMASVSAMAAQLEKRRGLGVTCGRVRVCGWHRRAAGHGDEDWIWAYAQHRRGAAE